MMLDFVVVGRTRNMAKIKEVCQILKNAGKSYYCFAKNQTAHVEAGFDLHEHPDKIADQYESANLSDTGIRKIFDADLEGLRQSKNLIMVLPAGNSAHIEAGIAYGMGKTCYAVGEYEKTDSLYLIFDQIFPNLAELQKFLSRK